MKLSIITINLNNSEGLAKTIKSILSQTFIDYEFLIVDGSSSDKSIEIINQHKDKLKFWISEQDNGIYNAMNKGILKSTGEYCFFLNSGDFFTNERVLENIFKSEFKEDIIFGNLLVLLNGKVVGKSRGKKKLTFIDIYSSILKHQSSFIRRDLFEKFGLYNERLKIIADWEFFLKTVGFGGASYRYMDIDVACFDNNGISNNSTALISEERSIVISTYIPTMMQKDYEFLLKFHKYGIVIKYPISYFLLRVTAKVTKMSEMYFHNK